jgi:RimJ/RimL family protein N-acetyltransferase
MLKPKIKLVRAIKKDYPFIYDIVKKWLKETDHSVTVLTIPKFEDFFKIKSSRYVIKLNNEQIGFVHIVKNNEIGYYLKTEFQGMGYGTWAVKKLIEIHPRKQYYATINSKNKASSKLVEKLGFHQKGVIYEKINQEMEKK